MNLTTKPERKFADAVKELVAASKIDVVVCKPDEAREAARQAVDLLNTTAITMSSVERPDAEIAEAAPHVLRASTEVLLKRAIPGLMKDAGEEEARRLVAVCHAAFSAFEFNDINRAALFTSLREACRIFLSPDVFQDLKL